jgi:hypothetical protein
MKKVNKFDRTKGAWKSCSDEIEGQKKSVENKICKFNKIKARKTIIEEIVWQIVLRKRGDSDSDSTRGTNVCHVMVWQWKKRKQLGLATRNDDFHVWIIIGPLFAKVFLNYKTPPCVNATCECY